MRARWARQSSLRPKRGMNYAPTFLKRQPFTSKTSRCARDLYNCTTSGTSLFPLKRHEIASCSSLGSTGPGARTPRYKVVRQKGSHIRLKHDGPPAHAISVPRHAALKTGTLHGILAEVAQIRSLSVSTIVDML